MDIIRSALSISDNTKWFDTIVSILTHEKIEDIWINRNIQIPENDDEAYIADFFINDDVYINISLIKNSTFSVILNSYGTTKQLVSINSSITNAKATFIIYRQDSCLAINFSVSSSSTDTYTLDIPIVMDTINNNPDDIIIIAPTSATNANICTKISRTYSNSYYWYYTSNSNKTTNTVQVVPFVISKIDCRCDTIYGVCISPIMNRFITFNNEEWLVSNGIAIPCKDEINYYYI